MNLRTIIPIIDCQAGIIMSIAFSGLLFSSQMTLRQFGDCLAYLQFISVLFFATLVKFPPFMICRIFNVLCCAGMFLMREHQNYMVLVLFISN